MDQGTPSENSPRSGDGQSSPRILGDFELRRVLGRGGMGTVYEARQRSLDRIVALKVLPEHFSSSQKAVQRFQREAQAAAKLHHTHIIPIFARGDQDGVYFYAMELVYGRSLNAVISEMREARFQQADTVDLAETVPLPAKGSGSSSSGSYGHPSGSGITLGASSGTSTESRAHFEYVARHIAAVADALDYAHAQGVVHRDIKPHNLMLGEDGRIRIADFGLARLAEHPGVTATGEVVGSPLYMAPELLTGGPSAADHRADVYSLGATMYEWLTLCPPHPGDTRETVISHILTTDPRGLREHNEHVPVDLETICLKAMHRDPARRYRSGGEMRDDINRFLDRQSIRARRAGVWERSRRFVVRHQLAAVIVVAVAVVAVFASALIRTKAENRQIDQALATLQKEKKQIIEAAVGLGRDELVAAARAADPFSGASLDVISDLVESAPALAQKSATLMRSSDPVDLRSLTTPEGVAQRVAGQLYETLVPSDYFSQPSAATHSKTLYELQTPHDLRDTAPSAALNLVNFYIDKYGPVEFDALHLRAALLCRLRKFSELSETAGQMVRLEPQSPVGYLWRGLASLILGDPTSCLQDMERVGTSSAFMTWCQAIRGLTLIGMGRPADAVVFLDALLQEEGEFWPALAARALASHVEGDMDSAIAFADRLAEVEQEESRRATALVFRGLCHAEQGKFELALADYHAAQDFVPASATIFMHQREAYVRMLHRSKSAPLDRRTDEEAALPATPTEPRPGIEPPRSLPVPDVFPGAGPGGEPESDTGGGVRGGTSVLPIRSILGR